MFSAIFSLPILHLGDAHVRRPPVLHAARPVQLSLMLLNWPSMEFKEEDCDTRVSQHSFVTGNNVEFPIIYI